MSAFIEQASDLLAGMMVKNALDDHWWAFAKATEKREAAFVKMLEPLFSAQEKEVLRNLNANPPPEDDEKAWVKVLYFSDRRIKAAGDEWLFDPAEWEPRFEKSGKPLILGAVAQGGQEALADLGLAINFNRTDPAVQDFIAKKVPKFAFDVNDTTLDQLRREFKQAIDKGEGIPLITKRVQKVFGFTEKFRNKRIAQTEIVGAFNKGTMEGYQQSGVVKEKEWLSSRDSLVRDTHKALDGQKRPLNRRFSNGLMQPGDYSGKASEIIDCLIDPKVPIFTGEGWKPVSEITVGDMVLTHKNRFKPVTAILSGKSYDGEVVKIKFRCDRQITATPDHRILLKGGQWVKIGDIVEGDQVRLFDHPDGTVSSVDRWKLKRSRKLYNFAVEDDESYIANGVVMHNCRCTMIASSFKE